MSPNRDKEPNYESEHLETPRWVLLKMESIKGGTQLE